MVELVEVVSVGIGTMAAEASQLMGRLAMLEAGHLAYTQHPHDEGREAQLRETVVRKSSVRSLLLFGQLLELQEGGWEAWEPRRPPTPAALSRSLADQILDYGDATLRLMTAIECQRLLEENLLQAIAQGCRPQVNLAALATVKAVVDYQEAVSCLLKSRPRR